MPVSYVHIEPEASLPVLRVSRPFRAVLVLEVSVGAIWQALVSRWLLEAGCLYALAVGAGCSSWDDSIDEANLERFEFGEIPPDQFVMTTWHENENLADVFWFAKHSAVHPTEALQSTVVLHVATARRETELLAAYAAA